MSSDEKLKRLISEAQKKFRGQLPPSEIAQAVFDIYRNRHGFDGELIDVLPEKPDGYWTLERCKESALGFKTRSEWQKKGGKGAWASANRNGWLDECCAHMEELRKPRGYWTLEKCQQSARNYQTRTEWQTNDKPAWSAARRRGWLDLCCDHMEQIQKPFGYWTRERCIESTKQYETLADWRNGEKTAYGVASKSGWLDECTTQLKRATVKRGGWTVEKCKKSALDYKTRQEWRRGDSKAHAAAKRNGWLDECCGHMPKAERKPSGYWTKERCLESAKRFDSRGAWSQGENGAYDKALTEGWDEECCSHMPQKTKST